MNSKLIVKRDGKESAGSRSNLMGDSAGKIAVGKGILCCLDSWMASLIDTGAVEQAVEDRRGRRRGIWGGEDDKFYLAFGKFGGPGDSSSPDRDRSGMQSSQLD